MATYLLLISACLKKLDTTAETSLTDDSFWKTSDDLKLGCNYLYGYLPNIKDNFSSEWTDDSYSNSTNSISEGSRSTPSTSADWNSNYYCIRQSNNILEKSVRVKDDQKLINRYKGEALFFRAWAYFRLIKRFGDVPLILRTFDISDSLVMAHRISKEIILDNMYVSLDSAAAWLPKASALPVAEYGRITKSAALTLKARMALFAGTFNKFHSQGNGAKHLNIAISACNIVMSEGHTLFRYAAKPDSSYFYLFQLAGEGPSNKENILSYIYGVDMNNQIISHDYSNQLNSGTGGRPTRALADSYLYTDGLPSNKSTYYKPQTSTLTEFENRDPRMVMTIFKTGALFLNSNSRLVLYSPTYQFSKTGYKSRKYYNAQAISSFQFEDNIVFRYAEVLLIYAESKYELDGSISDQDLDLSINLIRARVGMPKLTNAFVTANGLDMREQIRDEWRAEFAIEGEHRYWNLIRWKTAEIELPKAVYGIRYFANEFPIDLKPVLTSDSITVVQSVSTRHFDPQKDYLWPIPSQELGRNTNLYQNPGWTD